MPVIRAMAECEAVCEHAHLPPSRARPGFSRRCGEPTVASVTSPLPSASVRPIPDLALTTDLIVGFPGETDEDFEETLTLVEEVGFDGAFTFVFSPRSGTEAATLPVQVPAGVKAARVERLIDAVQRVAAERNARRVGLAEEVLVEGPSRNDPALSARSHPPQHRPSTSRGPRPLESSCTSGSKRRRRRRCGARRTRSSQPERACLPCDGPGADSARSS